MKKGDWLYEQYSTAGDQINILMEILQVKDDEIEIKWYDTKNKWPSHEEIIARDEIEYYLSTREIIIASHEIVAKYLLVETK